MRTYIRTEVPKFGPQMLEIVHHGDRYRFSILHAEDEHYVCSDSDRLTPRSRVHSHDVYHLALCTSGESTIIADGRHCPVSRGSIIVTSPGEPHNLAASSPGKLSTVEFTFVLEHVDAGHVLSLPFHMLLSLYTSLEMEPFEFPLRLDLAQTNEFEKLCNLLLDRLTAKDPSAFLDSHELVLQILLSLARMNYGKYSVSSLAEMDPLDIARREIEMRFSERLSLGELARKASLSAGHFSRAFRNRHGIPPIRLQHELRMNAAKALLISSHIRISEIAKRVGYADVYSFSKMFRKIVGLAPRAYREQECARLQSGSKEDLDLQ